MRGAVVAAVGATADRCGSGRPAGGGGGAAAARRGRGRRGGRRRRARPRARRAAARRPARRPRRGGAGGGAARRAAAGAGAAARRRGGGGRAGGGAAAARGGGLGAARASSAAARSAAWRSLRRASIARWRAARSSAERPSVGRAGGARRGGAAARARLEQALLGGRRARRGCRPRRHVRCARAWSRPPRSWTAVAEALLHRAGADRSARAGLQGQGRASAGAAVRPLLFSSLMRSLYSTAGRGSRPTASHVHMPKRAETSSRPASPLRLLAPTLRKERTEARQPLDVLRPAIGASPRKEGGVYHILQRPRPNPIPSA